MDVLKNNNKHLVYAKLPHFFLFGVLRDNQPSDWKGTKVNARGGAIPNLQKVPEAFYDYENYTARQVSSIFFSMSNYQQAKVIDELKTDPERFAKSGTLKAIECDRHLARKRSAD